MSATSPLDLARQITMLAELLGRTGNAVPRWLEGLLAPPGTAP
jgi:hypothetical protein